MSYICFGVKAFRPNRTINIAHLTQQQLVQFLTSLAMTRFGSKSNHQGRVRSSRPTPSIDVQGRKSMYKSEHQVLSLLQPSIEPITFPCRADTLHITPRTRVNCNVKYELRKSGFLQNFSNKDGHLKLQNGYNTTKKGRLSMFVIYPPLYMNIKQQHER